MVKTELTGKFEQMLEELLLSDPKLSTKIDKLINLFKKNSNDTRLKNHKLTGKMVGQFAFSINEDIRIVYEIIGKNTVRFLAIGPHEKVYP